MLCRQLAEPQPPSSRAEHDRAQRPAGVSELVALPLAIFGEVDPPNYPPFDQELQPFGREIGAHPGQVVEQLAIAPRPGQQLAGDQQGPALTDHVESSGQSAILFIRSFGTHSIPNT